MDSGKELCRSLESRAAESGALDAGLQEVVAAWDRLPRLFGHGSLRATRLGVEGRSQKMPEAAGTFFPIHPPKSS